MLQNPVGEIVKKLRKKNAWSQEEFAGVSGIATRTIQRLEAGERANIETLRAVASVLKQDVADLVPLNEPIPAEEFAKVQAEMDQQAEQIVKEVNILPRMLNGKELLGVVSSFHLLNKHYPPPASEEEGSAIAALLELVRDYGDLHSDLSPTHDMEMVFETTRCLEEVERFGLLVFAGKLRGSVVFHAQDGETKPLRMAQGAVFICRATEIAMFADLNNEGRQSARFRVPYGPIQFC